MLVHVHTIQFSVVGGLFRWGWRWRVLLQRGLPYRRLVDMLIREVRQRRSSEQVGGRLYAGFRRDDWRFRLLRWVRVLSHTHSLVLGLTERCWAVSHTFRNAGLCRQGTGALDGVGKQLSFRGSTVIAASRLIRRLTAGGKRTGS
jgi:hypothetical protein